MIESVESKEWRPYILAFFATILFILLLEWLGFFDGANRHVYDLFFRIRGSREPGQRVVIAAIDEKTLAALGQ
jgi:CHASE2 domain-containing sensor protein